ncbi:unnamed protein product [Phytomonas sp. Hart1]|nr:unnamed protein product [Phytomonas sp. Hart1]|eukprot:CCW71985.1 unnamed protein product [Phytomonas sp. isolate Hart1]
MGSGVPQTYELPTAKAFCERQQLCLPHHHIIWEQEADGNTPKHPTERSLPLTDQILSLSTALWRRLCDLQIWRGVLGGILSKLMASFNFYGSNVQKLLLDDTGDFRMNGLWGTLSMVLVCFLVGLFTSLILVRCFSEKISRRNETHKRESVSERSLGNSVKSDKIDLKRKNN